MADWRRSFEMSISKEEFRRLLPRAMEGSDFVEAENAFVHSEGGRSWRISLRPLQELGLGAIRLERQAVEWNFSGYAEEEIEALVGRFELHFRRGGG
jgi:hypothetical protein